MRTLRSRFHPPGLVNCEEPVTTAVSAFLGTGVFGSSLTIGAVLQTAATIAVSTAVSRALAPKLPKGALTAGSQLQMHRGPAPVRRVIYGQTRVSGPIVYAHTKEAGGVENSQLLLVIPLADHEVARIHRVMYLNDDPIQIDEGGTEPPAGNPYEDWISSYTDTHLGTNDQTANAVLVSETAGEWTSDHRLRGIAYAVARLQHPEDPSELFPGGIPNLAWIVRGRKVFDPRDGGQDQEDESTWLWSDNPALCLLDYLTNTRFGMRASYADEIDSASFIAAANACDEAVELGSPVAVTGDVTSGSALIESLSSMTGLAVGMPISGTGIPAGAVIVFVDTDNSRVMIDQDATATNATVALEVNGDERRYRCGGAFDLDAEPAAVIDQLCASMAGELYYVSGKWVCHAGVARSATVLLTADDFRGGVKVQPRDEIDQTCNYVRGTFTFPGDHWAEREFVPQTSTLYKGQDYDEDLPRDLKLPWVWSPSQAQRCAKIELELARVDLTFTAALKFSAIRLAGGDIVMQEFARYGWTDKQFRIDELRFRPAENGDIGIDAVLREYAAAAYDWNEGEETTVDPAPNTQLPPDYGGGGSS